MRKLIVTTMLLAASVAAQNLTPAQKEADFRYLASLFATYYAPLDWKKQLFNVNAMDIKPWLDRVAKTETDLDFYELCVQYVASLNDTHSSFSLPSDFDAWLGFYVDIYDGKLLIDSIDRSTLPSRTYPFTIGDELVSIDGVDATQVLDSLVKYVPQGNPRSSRRSAAQRLTDRFQSRFPHAPDLGDQAVVVIKRQNGNSETYNLAWVKTGTPLEVGPVPSPKAAIRKRASLEDRSQPDYMKPLEELRFSGILDADADRNGVLGYGSRNPIFLGGLPATFTRRLGGNSADFFYSGTFKRDELTIGYIRIPNFAPPSTATALQLLDKEIAYMNANTGGLILDVMRNTGGNLCFGQDVAARVIPYPFPVTGFQTRPFWARVNSFYNAMISAKLNNASWDVIAQYEVLYQELLSANQEGRLLTRPVPLCSASLTREPVKDADGNVLAYQKPVMLLIDEYSTSTADSFAAMLQDANRAVTFGYRTNGAGGNNTTFDAGVYSEGITGMTLALQTRKDYRWAPDYPASIYSENVGVHPDIIDDYMTQDNLLQSGAPFVHDFLEAMAAYIRERQ
jgi:hypothetical protein